MDNQVRRAIDSNLSRMCVMGHDVKTIMENVREGKKGKKKLPAALVQAAVLILAAVAFLSVTVLSDYFIR